MFQEIGYTNIVCIDANESQVTDKLKKAGLQVIIGHGNYEVQFTDFVIYSDIDAIRK